MLSCRVRAAKQLAEAEHLDGLAEASFPGLLTLTSAQSKNHGQDDVIVVTQSLLTASVVFYLFVQEL